MMFSNIWFFRFDNAFLILLVTFCLPGISWYSITPGGANDPANLLGILSQSQKCLSGASTYTVNLESKNPVRSWMYDDIIYYLYIVITYNIPWASKTMKNKGFGHLKTRLFTIQTSKHVWFWGPMVCYKHSKWGWLTCFTYVDRLNYSVV